jgi:hypothetical protein
MYLPQQQILQPLPSQLKVSYSAEQTPSVGAQNPPTGSQAESNSELSMESMPPKPLIESKSNDTSAIESVSGSEMIKEATGNESAVDAEVKKVQSPKVTSLPSISAILNAPKSTSDTVKTSEMPSENAGSQVHSRAPGTPLAAKPPSELDR